MTLAKRDQLLSRLCSQPWPERPLLDALALSPTLDILDVGAGDGRLLRLLRARGHIGWPEAALREARRVLRPGGRLVVAAQGPEHLRETWRALGQTDSPPAPEVMDDTLDICLPVTITAQDARALAQSYSKERAVDDAHFPVRDAVHLLMTVQTE